MARSQIMVGNDWAEYKDFHSIRTTDIFAYKQLLSSKSILQVCCDA